MWADRRTDEQHQYRENTSEELPSQGEYFNSLDDSELVNATVSTNVM